jgi:hypothetical protein
MPYIKLNDRPKFKGHINEVLGVLRDVNDTLYIKGEYLGYFINRVVKRFLADPEYIQNTFNAAFFNEGKKKALANAADSIAAAINRADPIASAGELNYALSAVIWGFLGEADGFSYAGYGLRAYVNGILDRVSSTVNTVNTGSQRDMTMAFRRHLVIRGVLHDVMMEVYRRRTAPYEDSKMAENGDLWVNGKLVQPETGTALVPAK